MDYTIEKFVYGTDGHIIGVYLCSDAGDSQYLTIEEYNKLVKNKK